MCSIVKWLLWNGTYDPLGGLIDESVVRGENSDGHVWLHLFSMPCCMEHVCHTCTAQVTARTLSGP